MAQVPVVITVSGTDDIGDEIDRLTDASEYRVVKGPHPCHRCRDNDDPARVPMHHLCHCKVVRVDE